MSDSKIMTGGHVILYVNGRRFGSVFSFRIHPSTPSKEIGGIDVPEVIELAPTTSKIGGSIGIYRLIGDGGAEGAGIVPVAYQLPRGKYFSMQLIERTTDTTVFKAEFCRAEDQDWSWEPKNMTRGQVNWKALTWGNEVAASDR